MAWFTSVIRAVLPFVTTVVADKNFQAAGEAVFRGLAQKVLANINDPVELKKLATTMDEKAPELVGVIAANTEAAKLVDESVMPPGSVPNT